MTRANVLITGASSGLGAGMARELAKRGRHLALCARRVDRLEALKREIEAAHPDARVVVRPLDVNDHARVFETFRAFREDFGKLDRIVVNAGIGQGRPIGTGGFAVNREVAQTDFVAALAQCEAAMEIFRAQGEGHLVTLASMSAVRGLRGAITTYSASKAGLATLTEGIRAETLGTRIRVSTLYPGYVWTEINANVERAPFALDLEPGCRALVDAIERAPARAFVPWWPWAPLALALRVLPLRLVNRLVDLGPRGF